MSTLSRADEQHLLELLDSTTESRDSLPYGPELQRLKQGFYDRTFKTLSDADFWRALVTVAKKGGVRGKTGSDPGPCLDRAQKDTLRKLLPCPIGERDQLPHTEVFERFVRRFNQASGLSLSNREVWLAVLNIAK